MKRMIQTALVSAPILLAGTTFASAQSYADYLCRQYGIYCGGGSTTNVPEIDASSGLLAVGAVAAMLALVWEIKRRRRNS